MVVAVSWCGRNLVLCYRGGNAAELFGLRLPGISVAGNCWVGDELF